MDSANSTPRTEFEAIDGILAIHLRGDWAGNLPLPALPVSKPLPWKGMQSARIDTSALGTHDIALITWLYRLGQEFDASGIAFDYTALPEGAQRLLRLARAVPAQPPSTPGKTDSFVYGVGRIALKLGADFPLAANFVGEIALACGRLLRGKARFRLRDLLWLIEDCGPKALPIVSLISFLVGTILAYMGAVQLAQFGAQIYIADLVAIGMVREVGALMTGIILAGRTGAAYAAQLGTMQVNEEIDALRTLGISSTDYLVMPRLLALVAMVPLLTLYAGVVGVIAGMLIANMVFGVGIPEYIHETVSALSLTHILIGVAKGTVYGALVAFAGCLRGMQCGRSAQAVGEATTSAVVTSILLITVFASVLTVLFQKLGI